MAAFSNVRYIFAACAVLALGVSGYVFLYQSPQEQIANEIELARTNPPWGLEGTDPDRLDDAISKLAETQAKLAALQKTPEEAEMVATALYPISFLRSLPELERARQTFLAHSTRETLERYKEAQGSTRDAYRRDLRAFHAAFEKVVPGDAAPYGTTAGVVTRASLLRAMDHLAAAPTALQSISPASSTRPASPYPSDVMSIYRQAGVIGPADTTVIELTDSVCLPAGSAPAVFALKTFHDFSQAIPGPLFVGDILLIPTVDYPDIAYYRYYTEHDVEYVAWRVSHYTCPEFGRDFGEFFSILKAASTTDEVSRSLMLRQRSAGFEYMIYRMAGIEDTDMTLQGKGVAVELSAPYLFYVRSGFLSLFHTPQPDGDRTYLASTNAGAPFISYVHTPGLSRQKIVDDLSFFSTLHGGN